ncbi:hypothetical protein ACFCV8_23820 [Streptomyces sp. NPDC056347]|uniref:hypothetical protein n=1 Tax=Streptomyces sp. NPDC056347 TaxID=3345790 RepID=UPI0035E17949
MFRTSVASLACACGIALGFIGAPSAAHADPQEACDTGVTACYFHYIEPDGTKHFEPRPWKGYCYNTAYDGAVAGQNQTNSRVYLYKADCDSSAPPDAYVEPGFSWSDPNNVYRSFSVSG